MRAAFVAGWDGRTCGAVTQPRHGLVLGATHRRWAGAWRSHPAAGPFGVGHQERDGACVLVGWDFPVQPGIEVHSRVAGCEPG